MRTTDVLVRRAAALLLGVAWLATAGPARADIVRGIVRDQGGRPVFNADFNVYDPVNGDKLLASDKTDASGAYRLVLDPGVYDLLCQVKDVNVGLAPVMKHNVQVSGTVDLDYVLPPSVRVLGKVNFKTNPASTDSVPVYPCNLDFDRTDNGARQPSLGNLTSPFGTFVDYIEAGSYTVTANPEDTLQAPTRVYNWVVPTTEVLELHCTPAAYLASVIRDSDGRPVQGAQFRFDDGTGVRHPATKATSDANGFLRTGVEPGIYRVTIEPPVGSSLAAIRVPDIDLTTHRQQDFTLEIGAAVSGTVTDELGRPIGEGDWDAILESTGQGAATPGDNTGPDGRYRFVVAPGTYRLRFTPPASTGLDTVVFRGVALARDTLINVDYAALNGGGGDGGSPVVRFAPGANPTHTTASLSLVLSRPVQQATVEIFDASGRRARVLHEGALPAGTRTFPWDGRRSNGAQAHTGVYFVRARLDGHEQVTRFVLLP